MPLVDPARKFTTHYPGLGAHLRQLWEDTPNTFLRREIEQFWAEVAPSIWETPSPEDDPLYQAMTQVLEAADNLAGGLDNDHDDGEWPMNPGEATRKRRLGQLETLQSAIDKARQLGA